MATEASVRGYPASLHIDYPEAANRLTTFFRLIVVIPIAIIWSLASYAAGYLFFALLLMILFRKKYPRWWFDWNLALTRFGLRIYSYMLLLTHEYPSSDEQQSVHLELEYPDAQKLGRGMPLVKWLLAVPHIFILYFLGVAVMFVTLIAWFAILITGRYPRGMFDFVLGVMRWGIRVQAYAMLLITDDYPPFSLEP
ncbi:MAG: DUF4389 domain-containing protein [Gaiellales bacterium]|nr:MAG: DUF4389 domain-containing protein [Gaiellales bacterium]